MRPADEPCLSPGNSSLLRSFDSPKAAVPGAVPMPLRIAQAVPVEIGVIANVNGGQQRSMAQASK
ncbi:hypothetical protein [Paenibacillus naphthalenovorans]|uniref:hypothetical protein n=1 Tax=Paenibacillus naphthalenovorans TaxID=162209 RepID=UPI0009445C1E|nr:hypothetical protein [Paenibacillus naphthalenovorans]